MSDINSTGYIGEAAAKCQYPDRDNRVIGAGCNLSMTATEAEQYYRKQRDAEQQCAQQVRQHSNTAGLARGVIGGIDQAVDAGCYAEPINVPFPHGAADALRKRRDECDQRLFAFRTHIERDLQEIRSAMNARDELVKEIAELDAGLTKLHR